MFFFVLNFTWKHFLSEENEPLLFYATKFNFYLNQINQLLVAAAEWRFGLALDSGGGEVDRAMVL